MVAVTDFPLTGRRGEGGRLDEGPSELLSIYLSLPAELQRALERLARSLRDRCGLAHAGIIEPQSEYEAESGDAGPRRLRRKE